MHCDKFKVYNWCCLVGFCVEMYVVMVLKSGFEGESDNYWLFYAWDDWLWTSQEAQGLLFSHFLYHSYLEVLFVTSSFKKSDLEVRFYQGK